MIPARMLPMDPLHLADCPLYPSDAADPPPPLSHRCSPDTSHTKQSTPINTIKQIRQKNREIRERERQTEKQTNRQPHKQKTK